MASLDEINLECSTKRTERGGLKAKTKHRILKSADYIRKGYTRNQIIEMLVETEGIKEVQALRIYMATIDYLTPDSEDEKNLRVEVVEILRGLISDGIENRDKNSTLKALDILNKMSGFYTEKVEANISGSLNFGFNFGDDGGEEDS